MLEDTPLPSRALAHRGRDGGVCVGTSLVTVREGRAKARMASEFPLRGHPPNDVTGHRPAMMLGERSIGELDGSEKP